MSKKIILLLLSSLSLQAMDKDLNQSKKRKADVNEQLRNVKARVEDGQIVVVIPMEDIASSKSSSVTPIINMLIQQGALQSVVKSNSKLIQAVQDNNLHAVKELVDIDANIDVNAQDTQGRTALIIAAQKSYTDIVKELLKRKEIDINLPDSDGMTPLHVAIINGDRETIKSLLAVCKKDDIYAVLEQRDKNVHFTPLARAIQSKNANVIKILLEAGANPTALVTIEGKDLPAIEMARDEKEIFNLLFSKAEEFNERGCAFVEALEEDKIDEARKLLTLGIYVDAQNIWRVTPLLAAAGGGHKDMVKLLLDNKADTNRQDVNDYTALHFAAGNGHSDIVQMLIDNKADINAKDDNGETPIQWAAEKGHEDIVNMLKKAGAAQ